MSSNIHSPFKGSLNKILLCQVLLPDKSKAIVPENSVLDVDSPEQLGHNVSLKTALSEKFNGEGVFTGSLISHLGSPEQWTLPVGNCQASK